MDLLKERVLRDGKVINGDVLQVSGFLNHLVDVHLLAEIGKEFAALFRPARPTKIITIEASGIPFATACAMELGLPFVIAKKYTSTNLTDNVYTTEVQSFTKRAVFNISVSKEFISPGDRVLILDDFLAYGNAVNGLIRIISRAGAELVGVGICIEKSYLSGAADLINRGINLHSLVRVATLEDGVATLL